MHDSFHPDLLFNISQLNEFPCSLSFILDTTLSRHFCLGKSVKYASFLVTAPVIMVWKLARALSESEMVFQMKGSLMTVEVNQEVTRKCVSIGGSVCQANSKMVCWATLYSISENRSVHTLKSILLHFLLGCHR